MNAARWRTRASRAGAGIVLLEVVLAMALLFGAAGVVAAGLHTCFTAARRVALEAQASDLAVTVMSEIEIGLVAAENAPDTAFEDGPADWTYRVSAVPVEMMNEGPALAQVQVTVSHPLEFYSYQLTRLLPLSQTTITVEEPISSTGGE